VLSLNSNEHVPIDNDNAHPESTFTKFREDGCPEIIKSPHGTHK